MAFFRIIPAHAGFTSVACSTASSPWDHPRTRGVYAVHDGRGHWLVGSSPHARGLRLPLRLRREAEGIIPARAGFTRRPRRPRPPPPDHPRMRGVYLRRPDVVAPEDGSSPHARGLLGEAAGHPLGDGIIPACAGFTERGHAGIAATKDHPRMRGVYLMAGMGSGRLTGSSPHARGLLPDVVGVVAVGGIIPACAGFTVYLSLVGVCWGDHPRMRGVYLRPAWGAQDSAGSSPHARGLR